ncbi:hypothetical protein MLD38_022192 [Melastoma candidum]|uniref:Uncharacterized protein n=1 Tax=Melastoma candidum TaxID=119954 RepID=A0ACB9QJI2_9MYRT|nr:hypothetical protein MLD38_022192 [Melastoma candidum]
MTNTNIFTCPILYRIVNRRSLRGDSTANEVEFVDLVESTVKSDEEPKKTEKAAEKRSVLLFGLFSAADKVDRLLMLLGSIGACLHGAALPVFFVLFGKMIDSLGNLSHDPRKLSSNVAQYALYLVYLGLVVFGSAWMGKIKMPALDLATSLDLHDLSSNLVNFKLIGVAFGMQTGERQTAWLRLKYLQAVLKKDIIFFDTEAKDRNLLYHISSDAILVQDAIGDKAIPCVAFHNSSWHLLSDSSPLLTLAVVPLIAVAGGAYTIIMSTLSEKGEAAYAEAGMVAEEVISQIRTVYSFVGEEKAIKSYTKSLNRALKLGRNNGLAKGLGVGFTYGLLFCAWALLLCFAYPSHPNMIFEGLSFIMRAGKTIAIVGPSGSGKSTIIAMLQRFYDPTSGMILVDGIDVKNIQLKWFREQMGLVSQEPALFVTTVGANMDQVIEAAKAVGEGGTQLSGGQKQRIAIARAESGLVVQQALDKLMENRTTMVVAYRFTTIQGVDIIMVMKNGRVTESGSHSELLSRGGDSGRNEAPLFALGITHILSSFYSRNDHDTKHEVNRIAILFVAVAAITIPIYLLQHFFYTLMGERITRLRSRMFTAILQNVIGWLDLDENSTGSLTSILAADATLVRSALADRLSNIVQNVALMVTAFVIAFTLSWRLAAVVVASFPLLVGASIAEQLFLKGFGGGHSTAYSRATVVAREA